ncbi:transposase [Corynebacterium glyciniphilum]|uniref:transposase n=1 Tax=Corynebacterium glyciniphilum TaxID=1404244 RepID=UPI003DA14F60
MDDKRLRQFTDTQWDRITPLLPSSAGRRGRPFHNNRSAVEGIIHRFRAGIAWRDLPDYFGPWQTVWKRHRRYVTDGTGDGGARQGSSPMPMLPGTSTGPCRWTQRLIVPISTRRTRRGLSSTQGARANYTKQGFHPTEPAGHTVSAGHGMN